MGTTKLPEWLSSVIKHDLLVYGNAFITAENGKAVRIDPTEVTIDSSNLLVVKEKRAPVTYGTPLLKPKEKRVDSKWRHPKGDPRIDVGDTVRLCHFRDFRNVPAGSVMNKSHSQYIDCLAKVTKISAFKHQTNGDDLHYHEVEYGRERFIWIARDMILQRHVGGSGDSNCWVDNNNMKPCYAYFAHSRNCADCSDHGKCAEARGFTNRQVNSFFAALNGAYNCFEKKFDKDEEDCKTCGARTVCSAACLVANDPEMPKPTKWPKPSSKSYIRELLVGSTGLSMDAPINDLICEYLNRFAPGMVVSVLKNNPEQVMIFGRTVPQIIKEDLDFKADYDHLEYRTAAALGVPKDMLGVATKEYVDNIQKASFSNNVILNDLNKGLTPAYAEHIDKPNANRDVFPMNMACRNGRLQYDSADCFACHNYYSCDDGGYEPAAGAGRKICSDFGCSSSRSRELSKCDTCGMSEACYDSSHRTKKEYGDLPGVEKYMTSVIEDNSVEDIRNIEDKEFERHINDALHAIKVESDLRKRGYPVDGIPIPKKRKKKVDDRYPATHADVEVPYLDAKVAQRKYEASAEYKKKEIERLQEQVKEMERDRSVDSPSALSDWLKKPLGSF